MKKWKMGICLLLALLCVPFALAAAEEFSVSGNIQPQDLEGLFEGYTLRSYQINADADSAYATYSSITDGVLTFKSVTLNAELAVVSESNSMPVPLSQTLLERLETEPFNTLFNVEEYERCFATQDVLDTSLIPITDEIVSSDLQEPCLLLITQNTAAQRFLHVVSKGENGSYTVQTSPELPSDARLDTYHSGDGTTIITWGEGDTMAAFVLNEAGRWLLSVATRGDEGDFTYSTLYCGFEYRWENMDADEYWDDRLMIGSAAPIDLMNVKLSDTPNTIAELTAVIDRSGWAVVDNPDPEDRLHLREKADKDAASLGKFWSGTPVKVLETSGDWSRVQIGTDGHLEGWMMSRYLTTGEAMDAVEAVFPELWLKNDYRSEQLFSDAAMKKPFTPKDVNGFTVVGLIEKKAYIVLNEDGETAYAPQSWFGDGDE